MNNIEYVTVDGRQIPIEGERNLLELIRKAGIDIPTFCYHSELSVYGACRLCLVEIEGRGLTTSCSTVPEPGMCVRTHTEEVRAVRKVAVELLLANHDQQCPTCPKNGSCQLQDLARKMGIEQVRFKPTHAPEDIDRSSPALVRNPAKCVLCGDCVRACAEIQAVGAIDFVGRGAECSVKPAFGKELSKVECVYCGLCASVCPTGAITPRSAIGEAWADLWNERKTVVVQIAPAVRVAVGERFGLEPGTVATGQLVAALKALGFDQVYDTSFAADLTVIEEANEFLKRKTAGGKLPQFTSCCPAWVKFAEQYFPGLLPHLSSCRSPQQMFGSLAKNMLPAELGIAREDLAVVSIMPCTAKKFECTRPEFAAEGIPDVDHVLTTQELVRMIEERGLRFKDLEPASMDMPFGFKTGAGVIFGASGGVTEAVLRYAAEKVTGVVPGSVEFRQVRGEEGMREATITLGGKALKLAVVHGLANARRLAEKVVAGEGDWDLIEVMACPGGCVGGAGQPVARDPETRRKRAVGLHNSDRMLDFHTSQDNHIVEACYRDHLGEIGGPKAHHLLHTGYLSRKRLMDTGLDLMGGSQDCKIDVSVCLGTSCMLRGGQAILHELGRLIEERGLHNTVDLRATFCLERCDRGPNVCIDGNVIEKCTLARACEALDARLERLALCETARDDQTFLAGART